MLHSLFALLVPTFLPMPTHNLLPAHARLPCASLSGYTIIDVLRCEPAVLAICARIDVPLTGLQCQCVSVQVLACTPLDTFTHLVPALMYAIFDYLMWFMVSTTIGSASLFLFFLTSNIVLLSTRHCNLCLVLRFHKTLSCLSSLICSCTKLRSFLLCLPRLTVAPSF